MTRIADPTDRRAKLVVPTDSGREVVAIAQGLVPEVEERIAALIGRERIRALRADLERIRRAANVLPVHAEAQRPGPSAVTAPRS